jgi:hypothetical protein
MVISYEYLLAIAFITMMLSSLAPFFTAPGRRYKRAKRKKANVQNRKQRRTSFTKETSRE